MAQISIKPTLLALSSLFNLPARRRQNRIRGLGDTAFETAFELRDQRRALAKLPPHLLKDIGLTAQEAATEAERPIWDVPANWRR